MPFKTEKTIIPNNNHIVRHASKSKINNKSGLPTGEAFRLQEKDKLEDESGYGLSVNWLEYYGTNEETCLQKIQEDLKKSLHINTNSKLVLLNVGRTKSSLQQDLSISLEFFRYKSRRKNEAPSHSLVKGYEPNQAAVADAIALTTGRIIDTTL